MTTHPSTVIKVADEDGVSSLGSSWRIPRPSIHGSSSSSSLRTSLTCSTLSRPATTTSSHPDPELTQYQHNLLTPLRDKHSPWSSSQSTSSASSATEGSQSQLLSPSRLAKDLDTVSIASSMHFTIVNGVGGRQKKSNGCCSGSYQLPILVVTMTCLIFVGILAGVLFIQLRARSLRQT